MKDSIFLETSARAAEGACIGIALEYPEKIESLIGWLVDENSFYYEVNKHIWKVIQDTHKKKEKVDSIIICQKYKDAFPDDLLHTSTVLDRVQAQGMDKYLPSHAETYARIVREKFVQRKASKMADVIEKASHGDYDTLSDALNEQRRLIDELQSLQPSRQQTIEDISETAISSIKEGTNLIKFGFGPLDSYAGGMTRKEITIIGGRPGHGKTTLAINIIKDLVSNGNVVMLFNREMTNTECMKKILVLESKSLSYKNVRKGKLFENEVEELIKLKQFVDNKYKDKLMMYDDIRDISTSVREVRKYKPDVVIDDYIQLIKVDAKTNARRFEIEYIMNEYKWIAKEKNCAVLLISQLSRDIEKRLDPKPRMSDYSESGVIEQVCENALFVYYPHHFDDDESPFLSTLIAAKVRYGKVDNYDIGFNGDKCKFYESMEEAKLGASK